MESSEQCSYENSAVPEDLSTSSSKIIVAKYEDYVADGTTAGQSEGEQVGEQQVLGYLEVPPGMTDNATLEGYIVSQGDEIYVVVSEPDQPLEQSFSQNSVVQSDVILENDAKGHEITFAEGSPQLELIETEEIPQNIIDSNHVYIETHCEHHSSENLQNVGLHLQMKNDNSGVVLIPLSSSMVVPEEKGGMMQLAFYTQEIPESPEAKDSSNLDNNHECANSSNINEESVIVSQKRADSTTLSNVCKNEDSSHSFANDNSRESIHLKNETSNGDINVQTIVSTTQHPDSLSTRTINNAVSVIHSVSSTYVHENGSRKNVIDSVSSDKSISNTQPAFNKPNCSPKVYSEAPSHLSPPPCSNFTAESSASISANMSDQDEDSSSSEKLCMDLSQDTETNYSPSHEDATSNDRKVKYNEANSYSDGKQSSCVESPRYEDEKMDTEEESCDSDDGSSQSYANIDDENSKGSDHIGNNSSIQNADGSDMESDSKMDVDTEALSTEDEEIISIPSDEELPVSDKELSRSSENLGACGQIESENCGTVLKIKNKEQAPAQNILPSKNFTDSFSDDSQPSQSLITNEMNLVKKREVSTKDEVENMNSYESEVNVNHLNKEKSQNSVHSYSDASHTKNEVEDVTLNSKPDNGIIKKAVQELTTFHGALDSTVSNNVKIISKSTSNAEQDLEKKENDDSSQVLEISDNSESNKIIIAEKEMQQNANNLTDSSCNAVDKFTDLPSTSKENGLFNENIEESLIKPPKKTYVRKSPLKSFENKFNLDKRKIELFSEDLSDKESDTYLFDSVEIDSKNTENTVTNELKNDDDDFVSKFSNKQCKTYDRKRKKVPSIIRAIRSRSLRPRISHLRESLENESMETSFMLNDMTENLTSNEKEDEASVRWGDYLMAASFKSPPTNEPIASTSVTEMKKKHAFSSIRKRGRPKWFRSAGLKTGRNQWEKLIKSSPLKMKRLASEKRKLREKVKKQFMSLRNSENFSSKISKSPLLSRKRGRPKKSVDCTDSSDADSDVKKSGIKAFPEPPRELVITLDDSSDFQTNASFKYSCSNCSFGSNKVNNIIMHSKFCSKQHASMVIDYRVNDMDKRQRIRGEDQSETLRGKEKNTDFWSSTNGSTMADRDYSEPGCSTSHQDPEDFADNERHGKEGLLFSEKEVVWAKVKDRFWPALLWKLNKDKASVYLISSHAIKGLKVSVASLHSFDDPKWNKKLLEEAKNLPDNDSFVVAVQMSTSYSRKKVIADKIDPEKHFKIPKDVEFISDDESGDNNYLLEDCSANHIPCCSKTLDDSETDVEMEELDYVKDIIDRISEGDCDVHVLSIYNNKTPSERHDLHMRRDPNCAERLKDMSWFGPFKTDSSMQIQLFDYFYDLFKKKIGKNGWEKNVIISYIYEVWIPEAIIKAISILKDVTVEEAEIIFYTPEKKIKIN